MNPLYRLFFRSGTKEALFAALWLSLDERPGVVRDLSAASLVALAARYGVVLTEPQTRKRLADLEAVGVVAIPSARADRANGKRDAKLRSVTIMPLFGDLV